MLTSIRAIITDVDGTLTDGGVTLGDSPHSIRTFNTHDGLGHDLLAKAGIKVAWLSATSSARSIELRAQQLRIPAVDAGPGDKGPRFLALCATLGVTPDQVLYIGDDVNDLPAMRLAAVSACPSDAAEAVRAAVDIILTRPGGRGAFREAADMVLAVIGRGPAPGPG